MRAPETMRPSPISVASRTLLARDLLSPGSPFSPITPSSSTAIACMSPLILNLSNIKGDTTNSSNSGVRSGNIAYSPGAFRLSAPPTPTSTSAGSGVLVKLSDGTLAVKTIRKMLRLADEEQTGKDGEGGEDKGKRGELLEGEEVEFKTDGVKAFDVKKRVV